MKELIHGLELLINGTVTDKLTFLFRIYDKDGKHLTILTNKHGAKLFIPEKDLKEKRLHKTRIIT